MDHFLNLPEVSASKKDVVNQLIKKKNLSLVNHFIRSQKSHLDNSSQYKVLQEACAQGSLDLVIYLLQEEKIDWASALPIALKNACQSNHLTVVQYLYTQETVDSDSITREAKQAVLKNNIELVKCLLASSQVNILEVLKIACGQGKTDIINLLLTQLKVQPTHAVIRDIFRQAIDHEQLQSINLLLKDERFSPSILDNDPIRHATNEKKVTISNRLLEDARVNPFKISSDYLPMIKKIQIYTNHLLKTMN